MQGPGGFIDFVLVDSVARPSQDFREFVIAHSAESSRTAPRRKTPLLLHLYEFLLRAKNTNPTVHQFLEMKVHFGLARCRDVERN
jgi:hypothetical protein